MVRVSILRGLLNATFKPQRFISDSRRRLFPSPDPSSKKVQARFARVSARLPKFLQRYTNPLINAPVTHIVSFLVLHELTAVLPLVALFATFHYTSWMPGLVTQGKWFNDGVQKFMNYFKKKGWLGPEQKTRRYKWWNRGEGGVRIVTEFAAAYAITKILLPLRLLAAVYGTPWFARVGIVPLTNVIGRLWRRSG